jgi:hypothetical protein
VDDGGSYILYSNGKINTMRVRGVAIKICWFFELRVSKVNFLVLCVIVIFPFYCINIFYCYIIKV